MKASQMLRQLIATKFTINPTNIIISGAIHPNYKWSAKKGQSYVTSEETEIYCLSKEGWQNITNKVVNITCYSDGNHTQNYWPATHTVSEAIEYDSVIVEVRYWLNESSNLIDTDATIYFLQKPCW